MMNLLKLTNLAVRFCLELCLLAALGYWGWQSSTGLIAHVSWGLGLPLVIAIIWGYFLAPAAKTRLNQPWRLPFELILFGIAVVALYAARQSTLAFAFAILYLFNKGMMLLWRQT